MLDKNYDAPGVEPRIAKKWDEANAFAAGAGAKAGAEPYCIVIPPPNVTGSLHMGHALNNTLQDILIRFERMRGKDVLWQPGMDHAGIATQMVVERQLAEQQQPDRHTMEREKFIERIWEWKEQSGGVIFNQLKRLGASCDWSRERFTMDEGLSKAVTKVFVQLYNEGLIYKDKRLVNWDPKLLTAISDLEVEQIEVKGHMWHFKYPLDEGVTYEHPYNVDEEGNHTHWKPSDGEPAGYETRDYLVVATTRPETMLGDTGVAVHPDDPRYKTLVGKHVILPLVGRKIPIVADEYPDPEAGTGAVKMTPAHDFNDFEVGKRAGLKVLNIFKKNATVSILQSYAFWENTTWANEFGDPIDVMDLLSFQDVDTGEIRLIEHVKNPTLLFLQSLENKDRFIACELIIPKMENDGLLDHTEPHTHQVPHGDRSGVPIEPYLTDQWYVDAATLAKPAIASVKEGRTNFVPKNWENTYFNWMENIQPWCISRQLWWGHQIPAWYGSDKEWIRGEFDIRAGIIHKPKDIVFVAKTEAEAITQAKKYYGDEVRVDVGEFSGGGMSGDEIDSVTLVRDEDVLDTWFSSALWPFSTLGWPDKTPELARYYPTVVLVTGFDIIFFWVARMMMLGLHFMKDKQGKPVEPFHTVYVHALVRDKSGAKMSKSKGNVIDPLELIDEYGADALRFTLAIMAAQGRDVKLDPARIAGYRNFGTKLWNATRFAQMNGVAHDAAFDPASASQTVNRWILAELSKCVEEVTSNIQKYRFNDAAGALYKFVWNSFCDWYLELLKPVFSGTDEAAKKEAQACAAYVLDEIYRLLHPFMPFMTEELWDQTASKGAGRDTLLCHATWPIPLAADEAAAAEINWLVALVSEIRSVRAEMGVNPADIMPLVIVDANKTTMARVTTHEAAIQRLARVEPVSFADSPPKGSAQIVLGEANYCLPLAGTVDLSEEATRLQRELKKLDGEIRRLNGKLDNEKFVANAPPDVVAEEREKLADYRTRQNRVALAFERVKQAL